MHVGHASLILGIAFAFAGCQTKTPSQTKEAMRAKEPLVLEREFPHEIGEPVYLLKPSSFPVSDMMAVWMPRQPPPSKDRPPVTVAAIGPKDTTPPLLTKPSITLLRQIVADLPPNLPKRAVFLVSSHGAVVEVVLARSRDKLNERVFAARLRALEFAPATYAGKPIAVICEMDLVTGLIGPQPPKEPNQALEPTPTSVTPPAAQESRRP